MELVKKATQNYVIDCYENVIAFKITVISNNGMGC